MDGRWIRSTRGGLGVGSMAQMPVGNEMSPPPGCGPSSFSLMDGCMLVTNEMVYGVENTTIKQHIYWS